MGRKLSPFVSINAAPSHSPLPNHSRINDRPIPQNVNQGIWLEHTRYDVCEPYYNKRLSMNY